MKKSLIIFIAAFVTINVAAQKKNLTAPSATVGGEWLVSNGVGINGSVKLPFSDGFSAVANASYDVLLSKVNSYKNLSNLSLGIRAGGEQDIYAQLGLGYSHITYRYDYGYNGVQRSGLSFQASGGYVLANNIDLGAELGILTYKRYEGADIWLKIKIAYVFSLKKKTIQK